MLSIEEIDKMDVQAAVEYSVTKIVEQGGQSINDEGSCLYCGPNDTHCAVGWLVGKENIEFLEGNYDTINQIDLDELIDNLDTRLPNLINRENVDLFETLQRFHDATRSECRKRILVNLEEYGINTSNPIFQKWIGMGR